MVRSLVPVSTWEPGAQSVPDNRVSLMLPYLPVDIADPRARLAEVKARVRARRTGREPKAGGSISTAAEYRVFRRSRSASGSPGTYPSARSRR
jgi:hypothetical protein